MDQETVNRLHAEMKRREELWLHSGKLKFKAGGKIDRASTSRSLYASFMDAWRDWKHAADQLDLETDAATANQRA